MVAARPRTYAGARLAHSFALDRARTDTRARHHRIMLLPTVQEREPSFFDRHSFLCAGLCMAGLAVGCLAFVGVMA